ncbi:hypothetical protein OIU84_001939 [Salix udensis]|uniref:Uncharacterized protein n=1 Tax=Salix udensis TaxID=889485 RepID=A0AAD6K8M3_9ROSI|nr:hypothetical protein OIU84_001939 [Salix udensis]
MYLINNDQSDNGCEAIYVAIMQINDDKTIDSERVNRRSTVRKFIAAAGGSDEEDISDYADGSDEEDISDYGDEPKEDNLLQQLVAVMSKTTPTMVLNRRKTTCYGTTGGSDEEDNDDHGFDTMLTE